MFQAILKGSGEGGAGRTLSPSPPEQRQRPLSSYMTPGKQIIPADSIQVNKTLGEGEFGVVQQGIWTTERGDKVKGSLTVTGVGVVQKIQIWGEGEFGVIQHEEKM